MPQSQKHRAAAKRRSAAEVSPEDKVFHADLMRRLGQGDREAVQLVMTQLDVLTPDLARFLVEYFGPDDLVWLPNLRELDVESAGELSKANSALCLPGLTRLGQAVATALVGQQSVLSLDGLGEVDAETAAILVRPDYTLRLPGLRTICEGVARALAAGTAGVGLDGLTQLDEPILQALAEASKGSPGGLLSLGGIATCSLDVSLARGLVKIDRDLCLGGVRYVQPEVASILKNCRKGLFVPSLHRIGIPALASLAQVPGTLDLSGLPSLPLGGMTGVHALVARSADFRLGRSCAMGRRARMLLEKCDRLILEERDPAEAPSSRAAQLHDHGIPWKERKKLARSICEDVYTSIAGQKIGPCKAPRPRWLTERVNDDVSLPHLRWTKGRNHSAGVTCLDVLWFLAEKKAAEAAGGNRILEDHILTENIHKAVALATGTGLREVRDGEIASPAKAPEMMTITRGAEGLFNFLEATVENQTIDVLRQRKRRSEIAPMVSMDAENPEGGESLADVLSDEGATATASGGMVGLPASSADGVLAQAEDDFQKAEKDLKAAGKGRLRAAKKKRRDALCWLEWLKESLRRSESPGQPKLTQQEFMETFKKKHPELAAGQPLLSRLIKEHRRKRAVEE